MRACWAATLLLLVQRSLASCAICRGTFKLLPTLAPAPQPCRSSSFALQPSAEISGYISFSSLWFLSRKLCPILCVSSRVHSTVTIVLRRLRAEVASEFEGLLGAPARQRALLR